MFVFAVVSSFHFSPNMNDFPALSLLLLQTVLDGITRSMSLES